MAAWSATDNFESYSVASISGDNGGTGFSAGYVLDAGAMNVVSSPTHSGTRAVLMQSTASSCDAHRLLTAGVDSGIFRIYIEADNLPTGTKGFYPTLFYEGLTARFGIEWGCTTISTGNTITFSNLTTGVTLSTAAVAATWYYVDVQFDQVNNRARASFNGGAWSTYVTAAGGSYTVIDRLRWTTADGNATDQGYHIDDIGIGTGPVVAAANTSLLSMMGVG